MFVDGAVEVDVARTTRMVICQNCSIKSPPKKLSPLSSSFPYIWNPTIHISN